MNDSPGAYFAVSVAALIAAACQQNTAPTPAAGGTSTATANSMPALPTGDKVQCLGIHACKGQSACHVAGGHACAGQNACKGKGWISVTATECTAKGGTVIKG